MDVEIFIIIIIKELTEGWLVASDKNVFAEPPVIEKQSVLRKKSLSLRITN